MLYDKALPRMACGKTKVSRLAWRAMCFLSLLTFLYSHLHPLAEVSLPAPIKALPDSVRPTFQHLHTAITELHGTIPQTTDHSNPAPNHNTNQRIYNSWSSTRPPSRPTSTVLSSHASRRTTSSSASCGFDVVQLRGSTVRGPGDWKGAMLVDAVLAIRRRPRERRSDRLDDRCGQELQDQVVCCRFRDNVGLRLAGWFVGRLVGCLIWIRLGGGCGRVEKSRLLCGGNRRWWGRRAVRDGDAA